MHILIIKYNFRGKMTVNIFIRMKVILDTVCICIFCKKKKLKCHNFWHYYSFMTSLLCKAFHYFFFCNCEKICTCTYNFLRSFLTIFEHFRRVFVWNLKFIKNDQKLEENEEKSYLVHIRMPHFGDESNAGRWVWIIWRKFHVSLKMENIKIH